VYEYNPSSLRGGGPPTGSPATGLVGAASTVNLLVTAAGGLYNVDDGMTGLRLHLVHADNTVDIRMIASNTAVNIVPTLPFSQAPAAGATWYVGGIPAFWKSWFDHSGDPTRPKSFIHLSAGYGDVGADQILYGVGYVGDFNTGATWDVDLNMNAARAKALISYTGRWMAVEFTNSIPDETFLLTWYDIELKVVGARQI
jgi:hypothetical protein